jgi:hypothetical protein
MEKLPSHDIPNGFEVIAPEGYLFDSELSSLICHGMSDLKTRCSEVYEIIPEKVELDIAS